MLLHGWGASRESLRGLGILFQHLFQVHLIDLPGFGEAPLPPVDWDTNKYADLVDRYLAERRLGSVVLLGHSFGGRVAIRLAARKVPHVQGLVLLGVPGLPRESWSWRRARRVAIRLLRRVLSWVRPLTGPGPLERHSRRFGSRDYLAAGALRPLLVRTVNEDLSECARAVTCPVLLVYGENDTESPPLLGRRYSALMGDRATLEVVPHKDHYLYTGTGAHLCAFLIRRWLTRVQPVQVAIATRGGAPSLEPGLPVG